MSLNPLMGKEVKLSYEEIEPQIKFLQGKVLTVIEASISDKDQLKAIKSLINHDFSNSLTFILGKCTPECPITTTDELEAQGLDLEKISSEAEDITKEFLEEGEDLNLIHKD